jgi:hypothetical protein
MEDESITIGGALMPVKILSIDREEVMKIYKPRIDSKIATILTSLISRVFNLREVFKYPVIDLSPYPYTQLLEKPGDVEKIIKGLSIASYISYLASKGYKIDEITEIMSSRKRFEEKLSRVSFLFIGYDYEKMRKEIRWLPENLRFPMPEPSKSSNLMERLSDNARARFESIGIRYMDLLFIPMGGVIRSDNDLLSWEYSMRYGYEALVERLDVLNDAIERAYDLKGSIAIASPIIVIIPPTASEKEIRERLEGSVKIVTYVIENMGIDDVERINRWIGRDNNLVYN